MFAHVLPPLVVQAGIAALSGSAPYSTSFLTGQLDKGTPRCSMSGQSLATVAGPIGGMLPQEKLRAPAKMQRGMLPRAAAMSRASKRSIARSPGSQAQWRRGGTIVGVNSILNMKVFLLAAAGSGNLANEHSLDLLIS